MRGGGLVFQILYVLLEIHMNMRVKKLFIHDVERKVFLSYKGLPDYKWDEKSQNEHSAGWLQV